MNKKSILLGLTLALVGCLPMGTSLAADTPHFKSNKAAAEYFWNEVFNKHDGRSQIQTAQPGIRRWQTGL